MPPHLIDIGVNLTHKSFRSDAKDVIDRAIAAGVEQMIVTGANVRSSRHAVQLARAYPGRLYCTAGVHPHYARECNADTLKHLRELARQPQVVAIGECGLDYDRDFSPRALQDRWFEAQVELACELNLPLFLHEREAHKKFVEILARYRKQFGAVVIHCFTGEAEALDRYLALDLHIGITGWICDERRGLPLRGLVGRIPLQRLMLETDAPFLAPRTLPTQPKHGRNEPAFLPYVLRMIAQCVGKSPEEVAEATTTTARKFFGIV